MARPDHTPALLRQALEDEIEISEIEQLAPGAWRLAGRIRSDEPDAREVIDFLESIAEDACGQRVLIEGPLIDPQLKRAVWKAVLDAADRPEDVVQIRAPGPEQLSIKVRHQPLTLSRKRNRLPRLEKALPGWQIEAAPLGRCDDVAELRTTPEVQAWLAPFLEGAPGVDAEAVHAFKADARRQRLSVLIDAPGISPVTFGRIARAIRDRTDLEVVLEHRASAHRARDHVHAALSALEGVEGVKVRWVDKLKGVLATIETDPDSSGAVDAAARLLAEELGVAVHWEIDAGRTLMVDRIAADFPEHGILTNIRHLDEGLYEVEALLPLEPPEVLEQWSDEMEARWGVQIILAEPYLHAPDLRYRHELGPDRETIARRYNRPGDFPPEVLAQAREAVDGWDPAASVAAGEREDIRELVVISIDPARTRDLDDALSITAIDGGYEVGVHIADVSPFVPKDSPMDEEALRRSFTTYLAEGEIPVLPEIFANGLLSLHGGQDSPALSLFVRITEGAEVLDWRLSRTLMHNHCRLNYKQAQAVLDGSDHEHAWRLRTLNELAKKLRADRKAAGSLDLNLEEDPEKESHQLIEEFMLLANECVARFLKANHPEGLCLYRTHPHVGGTDWGELNKVADYLGARTKVRDQRSMQRVLEELVGYEEFEVFRFHVGRVLEKATYHFEQLGHGALAKQHYAHFTSPIRRYSDLIVHRLIDDALYREARGDTSSYSTEELLPICDHLNHMEIRVDAGSFESHRLRDLQRFEGTGRTEEGRIVGLMQGRAWIRLFSTDLRVSCRYRADRLIEEQMPVRITDRDTGLTFRLGQVVQVQTRGVDWGRKAIEAVIIG
jgi:VacB/RNase II family 3'-5' exoribonuclease